MKLTQLRLTAVAAVVSLFLCVHEYRVVNADEPVIQSISDLERLPVGLTVVQSPETAKAVTRLPIDGRRGEYSWTYRTEITAIDRDLTIVEFGAFDWNGTEWQLGPTVTGTPFGTKEFAEWYSCENGIIRKGQSVADPVNWHSTSELVAGQTRWFFIGVDNAGKRFRGDAVIEFAAELGERSPLEPLVRFSGSWKKKWKLLPSEWNPTEQVGAGTHVARWSLNGRFMKEEGQDSDGATYIGMSSFDEQSGQYLMSSFSSRGLTHRLNGSWDAETFTMTWRNTERPDMTEEWTYRLTGPDSYEFEFVIRGNDQKLYFHLKGTAERKLDGNE